MRILKVGLPTASDRVCEPFALTLIPFQPHGGAGAVGARCFAPAEPPGGPRLWPFVRSARSA